MSARDVFHEVVKTALQKEGWHITHDPFPISVGGVDMSIDLGAERLIAAERQGEKMPLRSKVFWQNRRQSLNFTEPWGSSLIIEPHSKKKHPIAFCTWLCR